MRSFKTYGAARRFANGGPVLRVGTLYIADSEQDLVGLGLTSVDLITSTGSISGTITLRHLERLGNANWATPRNDGGMGGSKAFNNGATP